MKRVCVVGGGRFGINHIKTLYEMGNLAGIVEINSERLNELLSEYPVKGYSDLQSALNDGFDGFVVATPAPTHYALGKRIIEAGYPVLIEKPMTLKASESLELVELAENKKVNLMVGHLLLFHPAIRKIKEEIDEGLIGDIRYIYSTRIKFGVVRTEENVWWSFAPHDISVIEYLIGKTCIGVKLVGADILGHNLEDSVIAHLEYPDGIKAHIFVSWMHPFRETRLVVIGSKGMISFDDSGDKKIHYYNQYVEFEGGIPKMNYSEDEVLEYEMSSPLENELKYFIEHLNKIIEINDGTHGLGVVKILDA